MIFSTLKFRSYNWLSEQLIDENRFIKETVTCIMSSQEECENIQMVYLNILINKRRTRNELMGEIYRRADLIEYDKVVSDFKIQGFTAESN